MQRLPRDPKQPILNYAIIMRTGFVALIIVTGAFWLFFWELFIVKSSLAEARTAVINVIVFVEIAYLFNCRSLTRSAASVGLFSNKWAIVGSLCMVALQFFFTYGQTMNKLFHSQPLSIESLIRASLVAAGAFVLVEFEKWCRFSSRL